MTRVRAATAADVDAVARLEAATFGADAWSHASVADELLGPLRQAYVAVDDAGAVGGYVVVRGVGGVTDLQRIAVRESWRRHGVAGRLLDAVDVSGSDAMLLEVAADNAAALAFYRWHGFVEIARRPAYYAGRVDAVVMERPSTPAAAR